MRGIIKGHVCVERGGSQSREREGTQSGERAVHTERGETAH